MIKLNKKFEKHLVGFNNSPAPLGERNDLHLLLDHAIGPNDEKRDEVVLSYFDEFPTRAELDEMIKEEKDKANLAKAKRVIRQVPTPPVSPTQD